MLEDPGEWKAVMNGFGAFSLVLYEARYEQE